jgi:DNA-directed RNA polymerase specialized sigma24 family protein
VDSHTLHQKYLSQGTPGYAIIRRFYLKYSDVLAKGNVVDINDVVHEIYVSFSRTDFHQIQNVEHYVMRAIKLHCWSMLDKSIRLKALAAEPPIHRDNDDEPSERDVVAAEESDHLTVLEGIELLSYVNLFKAELSARDSKLLNLLIDETERSEIAKLLELNLNTLDTTIRRLRIRLAEFLKNLGYTYKALERFV